jgi:tRNA uridine 5-carbamoylmethylation protein Kti12
MTNSEKIAVILRGLPGSGKSFCARKLMLKAKAAGHTVAHHTTDNFFMDDGVYRFDGSRLQEAHDQNRAAFAASLNRGIDLVICDNSNSQRWEYIPYLKFAHLRGYTRLIMEMPMISAELAYRRNTHGVPLHTIEHMIDRWELDPEAKFVDAFR